MRAVRFHAYGPPDVLVLEEVDPPEPGPGEILVEVHASSVNPVDCKIRKGGMRGAVRGLPRTPGLDVSGVIAALGPGVAGWSVGDEVFAGTDHNRPGTSADLAVVGADQAAAKPPSLTHLQAATLPLAGLTAWQCLVEACGVAEAGQKVLVTAASGGVGTLAVQLAAHLGAEVSATCSPRNAQLVRDLGAARVVDYRSQRFEEVLPPQDAVLCAIEPESEAAVRVSRRGGNVASITADLPERVLRYGVPLGLVLTGVRMGWLWTWSRLRGVRLHHVLRRPDGGDLAHLGELVEAGALRPVVDRVFPLEDLAEAHRYSESGRATGKIAVEVNR